MTKLNLRPVEKKDYEQILEWRNDPDVRLYSLTQHIISIDEHMGYWNDFLMDKTNFAFIATHGNNDIGVFKLKNVGTATYKIDIFLSKSYQNRGFGSQILKIAKEVAVQKGMKKLIAKIKYDNEASKKVFENVGFSPKLIYYEVDIK